MGKTRSLARALAGLIGPSHHMEYFLLFFLKMTSNGRTKKKMNLGNKEHPNDHAYSNIMLQSKISSLAFLVKVKDSIMAYKPIVGDIYCVVLCDKFVNRDFPINCVN